MWQEKSFVLLFMHNIKQKISVIHVELYCHVSWMGDDFHALAAAAVHNHILYNKVPAKVHLCAFIEAVITNTRSVFFFLMYWKQMKRLSYRLRCGNIFGNFRTRSTIFGNVQAAPRASGAGNRKRHKKKTADASSVSGGCCSFGATKCRTVDILGFRNFQYKNNESRIIRFFYFWIYLNIFFFFKFCKHSKYIYDK